MSYLVDIFTSFARPASAIGRSPTPGQMQGLWLTWKKKHAKNMGKSLINGGF